MRTYIPFLPVVDDAVPRLDFTGPDVLLKAIFGERDSQQYVPAVRFGKYVLRRSSTTYREH